MKKNLIYIALGMIVILGIIIYLSSKNAHLQLQLEREKKTNLKYQEEIVRVQSEREKFMKEKDKLEQDSVSYITLNSKLRDENSRMLSSLEELRGSVAAKDAELKKQYKLLQDTEVKLEHVEKEDKQKILLEKNDMQNKAKKLEEALKEERLIYYFNLGVAYTRAKLYGEAIDAYEKTIELDGNNADARYNLGLIYEKIRNEPALALEHYRRYVEISPAAEDAREVKAWIVRLEEASGSQPSGIGKDW